MRSPRLYVALTPPSPRGRGGIGKLSSGRAADLAGLPRVSFLQALGQYGVPIFDLTAEDLGQDLRNA